MGSSIGQANRIYSIMRISTGTKVLAGRLRRNKSGADSARCPVTWHCVFVPLTLQRMKYILKTHRLFRLIRMMPQKDSDR